MNDTSKALRILCLTPYNEFIKTPETSNAELLSDAGHNILLINSFDTGSLIEDKQVIDFNPDVIFCMMEYSLPLSVVYKKLLNKPLYAHIECIPPWRTGLADPKEYGLDLFDGMTDTNGDIKVAYKKLLELFDMADYRTISGEKWRYTFEDFNNKKLDAGIKYYTSDIKELSKYKGNYEVKNQVFTIARFVPIKRIHHTIMALSLIDKSIRPTLALVGYGNFHDMYGRMGKELGVDIVFYGTGQNGIKEQVIQESLFGVQIFGGMPIIEAAFYNKPCVSYNTPHLMEGFGDSVVYAETNNIQSLKEVIEKLLLNKEKVTELGKKANYLLYNNKVNIWTNKKYVREVEKNLKMAIQNFNKRKRNE